ncbi:hypothetical protein [Streptomyces xiamenensis]|uniref:hypothetical protein n=1 Tax=Streptomyces xiamenensis TaxID=408015 RepID=UPI003D731937
MSCASTAPPRRSSTAGRDEPQTLIDAAGDPVRDAVLARERALHQERARQYALEQAAAREEAEREAARRQECRRCRRPRQDEQWEVDPELRRTVVEPDGVHCVACRKEVNRLPERGFLGRLWRGY